MIEFDGRRSNGEVFPVEASFSGWQGTDGFQFGAILRDISVRKREAERIRYLAEHDTLTGLINRNTLHAKLEAKIARAEADGRRVALLVVGIDGFQQINDMLGHASGDLVLRAISERLMAVMPATGLVARLSGDEFAIAVPTIAIGQNVSRFAEQIGASFDEPLLAGTRHLRVRVSIGAAVFPSDGRTAAELLSNSHMALSRAKATRRGGHVLFEDFDPPRTGNALDAGSRAGAGRGAQRVRTVLPATTASGRRPPGWRRSPDPLASSRAWPGFAGRNSCRLSTPRRFPSE